MTASDNKVLREGINFTACAARHTHGLWPRAGGLTRRRPTAVTRQLTYQSFICQINAVNWFSGRFGRSAAAAWLGPIVWGVIKADVRAKSKWFCLLTPLKRKIEYKAGQHIWHLHKFNYLCYLAKTWGRTQHSRNLWVLQIFALYFCWASNLKYSCSAVLWWRLWRKNLIFKYLSLFESVVFVFMTHAFNLNSKASCVNIWLPSTV